MAHCADSPQAETSDPKTENSLSWSAKAEQHMQLRSSAHPPDCPTLCHDQSTLLLYPASGHRSDLPPSELTLSVASFKVQASALTELLHSTWLQWLVAWNNRKDATGTYFRNTLLMQSRPQEVAKSSTLPVESFTKHWQGPDSHGGSSLQL